MEIRLAKQEESSEEYLGTMWKIWTYSCLSKVFGESNVFLNPLYPDSLEEACDVLVFAQDMVLIIECKSGKLPLSTRRGEYDKIQSAINRKSEEVTRTRRLNWLNGSGMRDLMN